MNIQGMGLFILALAIVLIFIGIYPFFGKKLLKIRWAWVVIGSVMFIYYLGCRIIPQFIELAHPIKMYDGTTQTWKSILCSNVLMLDMCPMMVFVMPLLAIFEKDRKILSFLAPIAFFAGFLSIFGGVFKDFDGGWTGTNGNPYNDDVVVHFTAKYIFIGNAQDHMFWMMHMFIVILALMTLLTTQQKILFNVIGSLSCAGIMMVYAAIFAYSFGVQSHAFGVVKGDWEVPTGEFSAVTNVISPDNKLIWLSAIIGFSIAVMICAMNVIGFYYLHKIKITLFINKPNENKNESFQFKPFNTIGEVSLIRKQEIIDQWKVNWKLQ